jgi:hypothetical protein
MQELQDIFTKLWPNAKVMSEEIGEPYDTVRRWRSRGRIPERVWPIIIEKAARREQFITAGQLLTLNRALESPSRKRTAA